MTGVGCPGTEVSQQIRELEQNKVAGWMMAPTGPRPAAVFETFDQQDDCCLSWWRKSAGTPKVLSLVVKTCKNRGFRSRLFQKATHEVKALMPSGLFHDLQPDLCDMAARCCKVKELLQLLSARCNPDLSKLCRSGEGKPKNKTSNQPTI